MAEHNKTGRSGEETAANYLVQKGYNVLARNFRYKRAEVDLIIQLDNLLVFVEVKTRSSHQHGYPEEFVSDRKIELFRVAATEYIEQINWLHDIRFDIIAVTISGREYTCYHIEDAFH
ncbi:MAG: endonuclease [Adhaeribacter sp.]|nr:endonuclease [Adhaeribacter sp.]